LIVKSRRHRVFGLTPKTLSGGAFVLVRGVVATVANVETSTVSGQQDVHREEPDDEGAAETALDLFGRRS